MIEYNDDSFQDSDSSIIDLTLPTTGTYYAMVTSSPNSVALNQPLTGDYELFIYTFAAGRPRRIPHNARSRRHDVCRLRRRHDHRRLGR